MDKIRKFIEKFWYLISPFLQMINWLLDKIELKRVQVVVQLLSIYALVLGIRSLRNKKKPKKGKVIRSKTINTIDISLDPTKEAEELSNQVRSYISLWGKAMKKLGKMAEWVYGNKYSLMMVLGEIFSGVAANILAFTNELYLVVPVLEKYKITIQVITPIVTLLLTAILLFILVKRCFDSNMTIEQYKTTVKRKKELNAKKAEKEAKLVELTKQQDADNVILDKLEWRVEMKPSTLTNKQKAAYDEAYARRPTLESQIEALEKELAEIQEELDQLKI